MRNRTISGILRALAACAAAWSLQAHAIPHLSVDLADRYVGKGEQFTVSIQMNEAEDLYAYQFDFLFDPRLLAVTGVEEGGFLSRGGQTIFYPGIIDNAGGSVSFTLGTLTDDLAGVYGTGELVRINLTARDMAGISLLSLQNIIMLDSALADIAYGPPLDNYVAVVPAPGSLLLVVTMLPLLAWISARRHRAGEPARPVSAA